MAAGQKPKTLFGLEMEKLWRAKGFRKRAAFLKAARVQSMTFHRWETTWGRPDEDLLARAADTLGKSVADLQALWRTCRKAAGMDPADADPGDALSSALEGQREPRNGMALIDLIMRLQGTNGALTAAEIEKLQAFEMSLASFKGDVRQALEDQLAGMRWRERGRLASTVAQSAAAKIEDAEKRDADLAAKDAADGIEPLVPTPKKPRKK